MELYFESKKSNKFYPRCFKEKKIYKNETKTSKSNKILLFSFEQKSVLINVHLVFFFKFCLKKSK